MRIGNIFEGTDTSAKGRTTEAFQLAYAIAKLKSIFWGVGLGQTKIIGGDVIRSFYNYSVELRPRVSILNAVGDTLSTFGILGVIIRLFIEIYLFFKTKVLSNYYRTLLFFYIFIYQFTGSFLTNVAEYVIWALAFCNCFPEFDKHYPSADGQ